MKKYVISLLVILVASATSSFSTGAIEANDVNKKAVTGQMWWNYNGDGLFDTCDPEMYSPDENNFPDCPPTIGVVYCEIYAAPSQWDENIPDLSTITAYRMRPLL
jgi:hypothetical protein